MKNLTFKRINSGLVGIYYNFEKVGIIGKEKTTWYVYAPSLRCNTCGFNQLRFAKTAVRAEFGDEWETVNPWLTVRDEITNGGY